MKSATVSHMVDKLLEELRDELNGMITDVAGDEEDEFGHQTYRRKHRLNDVKSFIRTLLAIVKTFRIQNAKYEDCWSEPGNLGPKGMYANVRTKTTRLRTLVWNTLPKNYNAPKIVETARDQMLYLWFMIRLLEKKMHVDENLVRAEVDKT